MPKATPMGLDDRPADRQPHSHSSGFVVKKGIENGVHLRRVEPVPVSATAIKDITRLRPS